MQEIIKKYLGKMGIADIEASELANQIIMLSIKETFEKHLNKQDLDSLENELKNNNFELIAEYRKKIDNTIFETGFLEKLQLNFQNTIETIYNALPEDLKEGFVEILEGIKKETFIDEIKNSEGKIEDVLKNIAVA